MGIPDGQGILIEGTSDQQRWLRIPSGYASNAWSILGCPEVKKKHITILYYIYSIREYTSASPHNIIHSLHVAVSPKPHTAHKHMRSSNVEFMVHHDLLHSVSYSLGVAITCNQECHHWTLAIQSSPYHWYRNICIIIRNPLIPYACGAMGKHLSHGAHSQGFGEAQTK